MKVTIARPQLAVRGVDVVETGSNAVLRHTSFMSKSAIRAYWIAGMLVFAGVWASLGTTLHGESGGTDVVPIGVFSEMDPTRGLPGEWKGLPLADAYRKTAYELVRLDDTVVLRARSDSSTSAIGVERRVDLTTHPILEWRWKIGDLIDGSNLRRRSRFDAPARVVVDFAYDDLRLMYRLKTVALRALGYDVVPNRALMYVWANRMKLQDVAPTPHAEWIQMVPVRRGSTHVGTWLTERRNVRRDYRRVFGEEPPSVHGVALMTDANSMGDSVTTYYGDIVFRASPSDSTITDALRQGRASQ